MNIRSLCIGVACLGLLTGCSIRTADLTAISTRNVELDRVDIDSLEGKRVEGKSSGFFILFIPVKFPHLEDAVDDALNKGGGDLLTDAVIHIAPWTAILVGGQTLTVEGTVVKTRGGATQGRESE